jgi:phage prohead protease, HK97 family
MELKVKDFGLTVKGLDIKNRIVEGYFASFNTVDSDNEMFVKGAFAKSISENGPNGKARIKHLFNHWDTVGVIQELEEDDFGLRYVSKIGTHRLGEDVLKMVNDGIITEHSVGFQSIISEVNNETDNTLRILKEVRLWEGSSLDKWGANEYTPILKSESERLERLEKIGELAKQLTDALNGRTNYTDETYNEMVIKLNTLNRLIKSLTQGEPLQSTQNGDEPIKSEIKGIDYNKLTEFLKGKKWN